MHGVGRKGAAALPNSQGVFAAYANSELGGLVGGCSVRATEGGSEGELGASEDSHLNGETSSEG